ncbi:helix-turn-helix domain-containing protein [Phenylobacterium koreense]|uniref:helix-turn-helix domain-containing protein n=1 Tax=Phenylobacterium koreense TaxID=266125 RepID=UPI0033982201
MEIERWLADRVRTFRKAKNWSQERLAEEAGLHRTFISQIERASKKSTIVSVEKVAKGLGVTFSDLLDNKPS